MPVDRDNACPSCGSAEVQVFCPVCGQRSLPPDRSLVWWLRDTLHELVSLDGTTRRTLWALLSSPGKLTLAWVEGDRARYTPPLRLYLVSSVLFFGVLSLLGTSPMPLLEFVGGLEGLQQEEHIRAISAADPGGWPPDILRAAAGVFHGLIKDAVTIGLVTVVPATALILKLLFLRAKRWYYVDHLVHALHVVSLALLVWAIAWPMFFVEIPVLSVALAPALWLALLSYGAISFARVYALGPLKTAVAYPAMLLLGAVSGSMILGAFVGEDRAFSRVDASVVFWEEAYARYAERLYEAAVTPGRPAAEREALYGLAEVVYERAPRDLGRLDPHFVSDFAELRLQHGDADGALSSFRLTLRGLRRPLDGVGGSAVAHQQLGDSAMARELGREFLDMLDGGARGFHPERTNRYRLRALEIMGEPVGP